MKTDNVIDIGPPIERFAHHVTFIAAKNKRLWIPINNICEALDVQATIVSTSRFWFWERLDIFVIGKTQRQVDIAVDYCARYSGKRLETILEAFKDDESKN